MPTVFQTFDKHGRSHPRWRFKYFDYTGKRKTATGATTKSETVKLANQIQADQDAIRKGWRPPPKPSDKPRLIEEVLAEYLAWGRAQGGHGGRPWSKGHIRTKTRHLRFWQVRLKLDFLTDLHGCLARVEEALRELQERERAGKTLQNYAEALAAFCDWALKRGYFDQDPLKNLQKFDTTPKTIRRAPTTEEIRGVLAVAKPARRLLYQVALASGLRANELRNLRVKHLDVANSGLKLEAGWTKGRRATFQPVHPVLIAAIAEASEGNGPEDALLSVPIATASMLYSDLKKAGIPKETPEGKLDFHALRTGYATLVFEAGANVKEAQTLARHSTPELTVNVYARTRSARLSEVAESVGARILSAGNCPTGVQPTPAAPTGNSPSNCANGTYGANGGQALEGSTPAEVLGHSGTEPGQHGTEVGQGTGVAMVTALAGRTEGNAKQDSLGQRDCPTDVQREAGKPRLFLVCPVCGSNCQSLPLRIHEDGSMTFCPAEVA
jgi:integrase